MHRDSGAVAACDVEEEERVDNLMAIVEAELGVPLSRQVLAIDGRPLPTSQPAATLKSLGVKPDDMVTVHDGSGGATATGGGGGGGGGGGVGSTRRRVSSTGGGGGGGGGGLHLPPAKRFHIDPDMYTAMTWDDLPAGVPADTLHAILQVNAGMMAAIERRDPELHAAARQSNPAALRALLMARSLRNALPEAARAARMAQLESRLAANPFDVEAQRDLEDAIAQKNIQDNWEMAMEHMPEAFSRVTMLYVQARINGVPVKVFVDSGAQSTILSKACAERCGIMRLVDTKFAGTAVGVGSARILGRVHMAPLVIGDHHFACTFTVLESGDIECLLGLDMLKRFQCCIDLHANVLRLRLGEEQVSVPFLGEADIPSGVLGRSISGDGEGDDATGGSGAKPATAAAPPAGGAGATASPAHSSHSGITSSTLPTPSTAAATGGGPHPPPASASLPASTPVGRDSGSMYDEDVAMVPPTASPASAPGRSPAVRPGAAPAATSSMFVPLDLGALLPGGGGHVHRTAPATSGSGGEVDAKVAMLMGLGFPRAKVIQALAVCDGNVEAAAALLPSL